VKIIAGEGHPTAQALQRRVGGEDIQLVSSAKYRCTGHRCESLLWIRI